MAYVRSDRLRSWLSIAIWVFVVLEVALSIVVVGITAAASHGFKTELFCDSPSKLNYNIAAGVLTFIILPILLLLDHFFGVSNRRFGSLTPKLWLGVYAIFVVLWAAAVGSAFYTCSDLCSACSVAQPSFIVYAGKCCNCAGVGGIFDNFDDFCDAGGDAQIIGYERVNHWYEATQGLDIVIMILFVLSGATAISLHFVKRKQVSQTHHLNMDETMPGSHAAHYEQRLPPSDEPPPYDK